MRLGRVPDVRLTVQNRTEKEIKTMMTNKDRDFNRNLKDCSPLRGVHYDFGLRLELQSKSNLEYFEISVLYGCDIVGLHSIKAELNQNMKILVMLEHEVLQEHLAIPQSELRRNEFKFNENLFKVAKDEIRTKIKLTDIYLNKVWKDMEYQAECHEASTHFEDYMNKPESGTRQEGVSNNGYNG